MEELPDFVTAPFSASTAGFGRHPGNATNEGVSNVLLGGQLSEIQS